MIKITTILILVLILWSDNSYSQSVQNEMSLASMTYKLKDSVFGKGPDHPEFGFEILDELVNKKKAGKTILGFTAHNRPVEAWFFPGTGNEYALVVAGIHGSELSAVEVANKLIELLEQNEKPFYNVIVLPLTFPDNAARALANGNIGEVNKGRYTTPMHADPNRQMPAFGRAFDSRHAIDFAGRSIEKENQILLQLIQQYLPSRIVNLHAIRDKTKAGIYADPRTDCNGIALGFENDSSLAVSMAKRIKMHGANVQGNVLNKQPVALYYKDPPAARKGMIQKRNLHGSSLPGNRGYGVSLGGWASTPVCNGDNKREAIMLITAEFPGYMPSTLYSSKKEKEICLLNVLAYADAIYKIFLGK